MLKDLTVHMLLRRTYDVKPGDYILFHAAAGGVGVPDSCRGVHYIATPADLQEAAAALIDVIQSGAVKIEVNQTFALADAAEAHRALEARATTGSTILVP
jgi:NADPH:quinone reductase-like Zn-dependent oxidoreductase